MIKKLLLLFAAVVSVALLWLLFAPVEIKPQSWEAPRDQGYDGDFAANERLSKITRIELPDGYEGPEDVALGPDGRLYMAVRQGAILALEPDSGKIELFAETGGRPLGIEFGPDGTLYVADAFIGLLTVSPGGEVGELATETSDGSPIAYANGVDVTSQGVVYFTDASTKFGARANGGTLEASILDLMEHGGHGRVLKYDPVTGETTVVADGLQFANGIALTEDELALLLVETGGYSVTKLRIEPGRVGEPERILENLPGFPDNINRNADGTFWLGLVSPRNAPMDALSAKPLQRKMVMRLPDFMKPGPTRYGLIVRIDEDGDVKETLQDPSGGYALTTGAVTAPDGGIFVSSLSETALGYMKEQ